MTKPASQPAKTDDTARPRGAAPERALVLLARGQGAYYFLSGAWPVLTPASFQVVTGAKAELWLAQTVGLLLVITGVVLTLAARARRITPEIAWLGAGHAAVLGVIDIWCVFEPRTTHAYWLDAPLEFGFVLAWTWLAWLRNRRA